MNIVSKIVGMKGYVLEDGGMKYPIFEESLHAVDIFNNLVSSGYKFCGLPYDFRKDGVSIDTLPELQYNITTTEEQDMFDFNDLPRYTAEELRSKISEDDITYINELPAKYTILTREEFLQYLDEVIISQNEDDFLPINYFVHPSARFTIDEWLSGDYGKYFNAMETRRSMTYQKFRKLRDWLVSVGMDPMGDAIDILETYCLWGLDGIQARFVSKQRRTTYIYDDFLMQPGLDPDAYEITRNEDALVDRYGAVFPPEDIQPGYDGWKVNYQRGTQAPAFKNKISQLKEGEFGVVSVRTKSQDDILEFSTRKETITVTTHSMKCGKTSTYMFKVKSPDITERSLSAYWWSAKYDERVKTMANLRALAYLLLKQMKYTANVSSFRVMMETGCDIKGALRLILDKSASTKMEDEADDSMPTEADIELYVSGDYDKDDMTEAQSARFDVIEEIVNGTSNVGAIAAGAKADASMNIEEIYKYLYCAHFCRTHVSVEHMYKLIKDVREHVVDHTDATGYTSKVVPLLSGGFTVNVPCEEIRGKIDGYKADINSIKIQQSEQCCGFLQVTQIASEYGTNQPRHVAFEAKTVNLFENGGKAGKYLDKLMSIFEDQLSANVPLSKQPTLRLYKRTTCMSEYFRAAKSGYIQFPQQMGGARVTLPVEDAVGMALTIKNKITTTATYCAKMVDEEGLLTHYCVNADITPWQIFPRNGVSIPSASLPAVWMDWVREGAPAISEKLAEGGFVYKGFVPWTKRYMEERYFHDLTGLPPVADMVRYVRYCHEFREDTKHTEEFTHAPHIESLVYGCYPDETVRNDNGVALREEGSLPSLTVSTGHIVTNADAPEHGKVSMELEKEPTLKRFTGFDAEDFDMLDDINKVVMPRSCEKYISVEGERISTNESEDVPVYMVSQLKSVGYPVINLWGRKYIFRDIFGALWEVIV